MIGTATGINHNKIQIILAFFIINSMIRQVETENPKLNGNKVNKIKSKNHEVH